MKKIQVLLLAVIFGISHGCTEEPKEAMDGVVMPVTTYYLIRHAEKDRSDENNTDPELTQKGLGRAMHWAEILDEVTLDAIYSTDYERTSMTAAPTAVKQNITISYYQPGEVAIEQFKEENLGKNVLIVGHSNTTPDFVNTLIGEEKYAPMSDTDNGSLFIVQQVGNTTADMRLQFSCNCPD